MPEKLMVIAVDGNDLVALSPVSEIELARTTVYTDTTASHATAARWLVSDAFDSLKAEGYPRAVVRGVVTTKVSQEVL